MKKILIAIALVACMLLSFVACDTEEPLVNDPELNVAAVVSAINSDKTLAELVNSSSAQLPENELSDVMAEIKQLNFESTIKADADGENSEMFFAMKDGVLYVEADGESGYIFIEDDLKLVMVSEYNGKYYGEVSDTLTELLPLFGSGESTDFDDMTSSAVSKAMDKLAEMKLPVISVEDITVDGDKYLLSEEYIVNTIDKVLDTFYAEFEGDQAMSTQVEAMKAAVREYVLAMNIELYFYVQYEEIVGIGAAISPEKDVAEEIFDCDAISLSFDMNMGDVAVKADIVSEGENYNFDFVLDMVVDAEGALNAVNMKLDAKLAASDYVYDDSFESIDLKGTLELGVELKVDLSEENADGEIFALDVDYFKGNYKAYEFDLETFENVYSPELTELYGKNSEKGEISVKCVTTDGGEKIKLTVVGSGETVDEGEKDTTNYSVTVDCSKTVSNFPEVPAAAEEARQEALDEYDKFDFDFDEEFDFDSAFGDN